MFMRLLKQNRQTKAMALVFLVAVFSLIALAPIVARAEQGDEKTIVASQKMMTVYDQGQKQIILTNRNTLGEALKQAGFEISDDDVVEPSLDEELVASKYNVNIYRARPVVIVDGPRIVKMMSPYQTARQIVQHAELDFHEEDIVEPRINFDATGEHTGVEYIITRSKLINFVFYGKVSQLRTQSKTVADFLAKSNIKLAADERVNLAFDAVIEDGATIEIWREGKQEAVQEEEIAYRTEKTFDYDRDSSYRQVKTPGVNGKRLVTYEIMIKNGQEVSRKELNSITVVEPITQIEVVGMSMKYTGGGSKTDWLLAAGIPESMWGYAESIVQKESGWNPNAVNKSSGACGLAQALPCSKVPGNPYNPVDSLRWMDSYVNGRYGGWVEAYNFWQKNRWY